MSTLTKVLLMLAALVAAGYLWSGRGEPESGEALSAFPERIRGEWRTMEPTFEDRALILDGDSFAMDLGEHGETRHALLGLTTREDSDGVWYVGRYFSDGEERELHFRYLAEYDEIRLRNRDHVWWKRADFIAKVRKHEAEVEEQRRRHQESRKLRGLR